MGPRAGGRGGLPRMPRPRGTPGKGGTEHGYGYGRNFDHQEAGQMATTGPPRARTQGQAPGVKAPRGRRPAPPTAEVWGGNPVGHKAARPTGSSLAPTLPRRVAERSQVPSPATRRGSRPGPRGGSHHGAGGSLLGELPLTLGSQTRGVAARPRTPQDCDLQDPHGREQRHGPANSEGRAPETQETRGSQGPDKQGQPGAQRETSPRKHRGSETPPKGA